MVEKTDVSHVTVDVTQKLTELDGMALIHTITEACTGCDLCNGCGQPLETIAWTLRKACTDALTKPIATGRRQDGVSIMEEAGAADHMDRWILAMKIHKHNEMELDEKQIEMIKDRCAKMFSTVVAGQVSYLLKGKE